MIVIKRRLIFWLIKAYLKRWGRIFILCFLVGLGIFFLLKLFFPYIIAAFTGVSKETIGIVGTYTFDSLPDIVRKDVSSGLTKINADGSVSPDIAQSWTITDSGKTYTFNLKHSVRFIDGTPVTSKEIPYSFSNVSVTRPDSYTIVYKLKDSYSPFLVTVARPIFKSGFVGIGPYAIKKAETNGPFIQSLTLTSNDRTPALKIYVFYPTEDALKVAYALGEITTAENITTISFKDTTFTKFPHTHIVKSTNYEQLVAIFYNTQDKNLSDKKLRDALSYALPNEFSGGERAISSIPPISWAYNNGIDRSQDYAHAKLLLNASVGESAAQYPEFVISTLPKFLSTAKAIQSSWKQLGIQSKIQIVDSLPQTFQVYLGSFTVPKDPDQYTLWHSFQENNITNFKSTRIDTLLEDGRKTVGQPDRLKIYQDFQKYLQDEQPASFLYFPYNYSVNRK